LCFFICCFFFLNTQQADGFTVAEVDCTLPESKPLCEKHSIRGYPTILFFKDNVAYKYNRARKIQDFQDFVVKQGYLQDGIEKTTVV
jgi:protein disulfide-isomerase A1